MIEHTYNRRGSGCKWNASFRAILLSFCDCLLLDRAARRTPCVDGSFRNIGACILVVAAIGGQTSTLIQGYYCFEWEKRWHPGIDEPGVAFPHYAKTMRQYPAEAGISA